MTFSKLPNNNKVGGDNIEKYVLVRQDAKKDCGISCLLAILKYYKGNISKEKLRIITNTNKDGVNAYNLIRGAKELGFQAKGVEGSYKELTKELLPCIAHVIINKSYSHFIVIYDINLKNKTVVIMDPAQGLKKVKTSYLENITTNKYIILTPSTHIINIRSKSLFKKKIIEFLYYEKNFFINLIIISILFSVFNLFFSYYLKSILELTIKSNSLFNLLTLSIIFIAVAFFKEVLSSFREIVLNKLKYIFDKVLFNDFLKQLLSLPYIYHHNYESGDIIARVEDLSIFKEYFINLFTFLIVDVIIFSLGLITLYLINDKIALVFLISFLLVLIITYLFDFYLDSLIKDNKVYTSKFNIILIDILKNLKTITNLNIKEIMVDKLEISHQKYLDTTYDFHKIYNYKTTLKNIFISLFQIYLYTFGTYLIINKKLSIYELFSLLNIYNILITTIPHILDILLYKNNIKTIYNRINDIYDIELEKEYLSYKKDNKPFNTISIEKLNYSYNKKIIFNNFNLTLFERDKVIIYGPSGCGKSTLAKILMGYYKIDSNTLKYNNRYIEDYNLSYLKERITYIEQKENLFTDTIYENIVLDRDISYDKFLEFSRLLKIDDFLKDNPLKYDYLLEEDGNNLSGGERQRIILARSLIEEKDIYILDEACSQLDTKLERIILKNIFSKYQNKIIIYITHRLSNKDLFNKIINLGDKY